MARLLLILALAAVVFWVFSVVDAAVQPAIRHRGVGKPMWVAIVVVFPVLGGVLWFAVGRAPAAPRTPRAPDDDPDFLRGLGRGAAQARHPSSSAGTSARPSADDRRARAEQDERIRQLEQDLARLDRDDDDPSAGPRP